MEEIIYPINLDLRTNTHKVLVMKEGDYNSRVIEATITDNGKPFNIENCTVDIKWRKPDGHLVYSESTKINSSTIRVVCTEQMLCVSGISVAEIVITSSDSVVSTLTFNISVNETVASDFDIESSDEFSSLRQMKEHIANNSIHIPEGGTAGQAVIKDENGNVTWGEVSGGSSGDYLEKNNPTGTGSFSMNRRVDSEIGNCSVTEGRDCIASGGYSHAEGCYTTASGFFSHAEGDSTTAGYRSHAEGYGTTAEDTSHAEGMFTTATARLSGGSHAEGMSSYKASDICGDLSALTNDEIIEKWKGGNKFSLANSQGSHVEGEDCLALEESSHAEGCKTIASGAHSHAEGAETWSNGLRSHTEGFGTKTDAPFAHAEGYNTVVNGQSGHAEGTGTIASGSNQHVQGKFNVEDTEDKYAHIVGGGDYYNRKNIHTLDWEGNAVFAGSITSTGAFSMNRKAGSEIGDSSVVIGNDCQATGECSVAIGHDCRSNSNYSVVMGGHCIADSYLCTVMGSYNSASAPYSTITGGYSNQTRGDFSTVTGGYGNEANGLYSCAEGYNTIASGESQHVQGKFNVEDTEDKYAHIVGGGTSNNDRKNIHTLDWQGNAVFAGDVTNGNGVSLNGLKTLIDSLTEQVKELQSS